MYGDVRVNQHEYLDVDGLEYGLEVRFESGVGVGVGGTAGHVDVYGYTRFMGHALWFGVGMLLVCAAFMSAEVGVDVHWRHSRSGTGCHT